jgi:hypothetical protein
MKNLYRKLLIKLGYKDWQPIISRYIGFNTRDIIYECSLTGERKSVRTFRSFGSAFPIPTTMNIDGYEYDIILNGGSFERTAHGIIC